MTEFKNQKMCGDQTWTRPYLPPDFGFPTLATVQSNFPFKPHSRTREFITNSLNLAKVSGHFELFCASLTSRGKRRQQRSHLDLAGCLGGENNSRNA